MISTLERHQLTRPTPAPARPLRRLVELLELWAERRSQRHALLSLSDEMLKDIGVTRGCATSEADKWFWRA